MKMSNGSLKRSKKRTSCTDKNVCFSVVRYVHCSILSIQPHALYPSMVIPSHTQTKDLALGYLERVRIREKFT